MDKFLVVSMGNRPIFVVRSGIERGDGSSSFPRILGIMMERRHSKCLYLSPRSCLSVQARDSNLFVWYWISDPHILFLSRRADTSQILFSAWFCHRIFSLNEKIIRVSSANFFSSEFPRLEFSCSSRPLNVIRCDERTPESFIDANSIPSRVRKRNLWIRCERIHFETIYEIRVCYRKATSSRVDKCNRVECESLSHRSRYCVSIVSCIDRLEGIARSPRFHSPRDAIPMSSRMITRGGGGEGGEGIVASQTGTPRLEIATRSINCHTTCLPHVYLLPLD